MVIECGQQPVVQGFECCRFQFPPGLRHGAFGDDAPGLSGERLKQFIQKRLKALFSSAEQERDENREGKHTLARKILGVATMGGDKVRVAEGAGKAGQDSGMDIAKSVS